MDETPYTRMVHELCVGMGFCGALRDGKPTHIDDFIPEEGDVTVEQFLEWLFLAEGSGYPAGYDPKSNRLYEDLKRIFVRHMGSDRVHSAQLRREV